MKEHGKQGSKDMKEEIRDQKSEISFPHSCAMCQEKNVRQLILPMTKELKKCFCKSKVQGGKPCTSALRALGTQSRTWHCKLLHLTH